MRSEKATLKAKSVDAWRLDCQVKDVLLSTSYTLGPYGSRRFVRLISDTSQGICTSDDMTSHSLAPLSHPKGYGVSRSTTARLIQFIRVLLWRVYRTRHDECQTRAFFDSNQPGSSGFPGNLNGYAYRAEDAFDAVCVATR